MVAKTWKQPKHPLMADWITKMRYRYTLGYYSAVRKGKIRPFMTTGMDLESVMLSKVSQMIKERTICSHSYVGYKPESNK